MGQTHPNPDFGSENNSQRVTRELDESASSEGFMKCVRLQETFDTFPNTAFFFRDSTEDKKAMYQVCDELQYQYWKKFLQVHSYDYDKPRRMCIARNWQKWMRAALCHERTVDTKDMFARSGATEVVRRQRELSKQLMELDKQVNHEPNSFEGRFGDVTLLEPKQ